jgi:hypothetical protein
VIRGLVIAAELTMDVGFMKLLSDSFRGNRVFKMNKVLSSAVTCIAMVCDSLKQLFSMCDDLSLSLLIFTHCSSLLMLSSHDSCMLTWPQELSLSIYLIVWQFVTDAPPKHTPMICSLSEFYKSAFSDPFTWSVTHHNTNAPTIAIQSVNNWRNIHCCQLTFFHCSQNKLSS